MVPDRRSAPKIMSKEPIRNRNIASAIALYGTFGGLFLNCSIVGQKDKTIDRHRDRDGDKKMIRLVRLQLLISPLVNHKRIWHISRNSFTGIYHQLIACVQVNDLLIIRLPHHP